MNFGIISAFNSTTFLLDVLYRKIWEENIINKQEKMNSTVAVRQQPITMQITQRWRWRDTEFLKPDTHFRFLLQNNRLFQWRTASAVKKFRTVKYVSNGKLFVTSKMMPGTKRGNKIITGIKFRYRFVIAFISFRNASDDYSWHLESLSNIISNWRSSTYLDIQLLLIWESMSLIKVIIINDS